ncbi:universal stress protein [Streptomyces naganishii]|uniref:Universal stress protein n=1 Tax=Streptomyces naganishii JCM 4654 TaxID=1306179 RepID=A0A919CZ20_9ACTN|nr:universal stress protein [Streptomyces naganishii]GHD97200.1 universal stress protein [Streptomyces naganishii JCM 4654]
MLPPVVAGIDGSVEGLAAAEWAAREAVRRERALALVHVLDWHPRQETGATANAAQRHQAGRVLRRAARRARAVCPELAPYEDQVEGPPMEALLKAAAEAELLVLGSHGTGGTTGSLVGSVALGVVTRSVRPVVLVRADEGGVEEPAAAHENPAADASAVAHESAAGVGAGDASRDVLLGVDADAVCEEVVRFAFEAARTRGVRLRVLSAWHPPTPLTLGPAAAAALDDPWRAEDRLGAVDAVLRPWHERYPDVRVLVTAVHDRPAPALLGAARGAGLLVVGHRLTERSGPPCTGPVTHAVIHHATCPVAVVPHF